MATIIANTIEEVQHYARVLRPGDTVLLPWQMVKPETILELFLAQEKNSTQVILNEVRYTINLVYFKFIFVP
jgi:hypothetical protein